MKKKMQILLVEEAEVDCEILLDTLQELGHKVIVAKTGAEARLKYSNQKFDFVSMNMDIKSLGALEFVQQIRETEKRKNIKERMPVLVSGESPEEFQRELSKVDNVQFLQRPFSAREFSEKINSFNKSSGLKKENMQKVPKGEYLITEGGKNNEMYWVLEGGFTITKLNSDGQNVIVGEANKGELLGEMSFLDNLPRSASVRAKEDSEVLVIPYKKFMDVLDGQPRWFRSLMTTLSHRLRDADQRIASKFVQSDED